LLSPTKTSRDRDTAQFEEEALQSETDIPKDIRGHLTKCPYLENDQTDWRRLVAELG
jgi:hypothetical protein